MFLRGLDGRVRVFDDDPVFTRDHFEWRGFAFLMESAAGFSVHDSAQMHFVQDESVQHAFRPQFAFRGRNALAVEFPTDCATRGAAQNSLLHEVVDIQFLGIYIQAVGF